MAKSGSTWFKVKRSKLRKAGSAWVHGGHKRWQDENDDRKAGRCHDAMVKAAPSIAVPASDRLAFSQLPAFKAKLRWRKVASYDQWGNWTGTREMLV